ncbi:GGDEF domain-containing protein [Kibdelosporangium banguiense]|uniref:GGDEF domain-containing protein n=1 Tax=Kibdelosporangium banguiense TaxID=1365924 RepID=A0ABS4T5U7_9PSEU|nr:diguanylate cyclase [Kibdelosporangium banguiense]MBP2319832.1 GGDEF domain-containing protein [Kibdelosporangium banguiense]
MTAGTRGTWAGGGESDGELLVATADRLRWRAPELALVFARHAATRADAAGDRMLALRANALVVASLVRLGKHADAVEPAVLTLREAESSGERELAGSVRVDLAASTRAIGLAGSAFVLVRPMLEGSDARPSVRAGALAEIVAGLAQAGRREVIDEVLSEADRLYAADESLAADVRRVLRALLCARIASFRRRWGNPTGAVAAATEGMTLLDGLTEPATDSGQARAELGLEMVSALLDAGEDAAALGQADQTLTHPVRATSAAAIGRLMLILATRVHMPAGRAKQAHTMLAEIVRVARRHELDGLLADVLTSLAHAQETDGDLTDALNSLRSARAAEQRRLRADTLARLIVLEELGAGTRLPDDTEALLRRVVRTPARSLPDTSSRESNGREAASREMSGRELGGEDIGSQDILARELTGWEMVARERAAMEAGTSRALSELIEADHAAVDWPSSDQVASAWPSHDRAEAAETSSDWSADTGVAAAASSGGGRRRAPVEWSAADRVAADRAVSELASANTDSTADEPAVSAVSADSSQPQWPDPGAAEERDEETGLLNRQGLRRRLAAARRQARPTALTLVRLEQNEPDPQPEPRRIESRGTDPDSTDRFSAALIKAIDRAGRMPEFDPDVLNSLADHVRDMAPDDAELVRPEEGELAVLLPDTTRDEAEQFAASLRETMSTSDWDPADPARGVSVSTGVAQYQEGTSEDALLTAAREALTATEQDSHDEQPDWQSIEPVYDLPPEDSGYTYMQEYAQTSHDGPEPADPEMAEYLAGFPLPEYTQWAPIEESQWPPTEEPDMPPHHDAAPASTDTLAAVSTDAPTGMPAPAPTASMTDTADTGRSVLDRLDITRGSGGRRRAPDSFAPDQSTDYTQPGPATPDSPYNTTSSAGYGEPSRGESASSKYASTSDEILAAAEEALAHPIPRASIPHIPDPEEIPVPPDTPDIPPVPNPDTDPQPGRRPDPDPDPAPKPSRRGTPAHPDIDPPPSHPAFPTSPDPQREPARRDVPTHPDIDPPAGFLAFPAGPDPDREPSFPTDLDRDLGRRDVSAYSDVDLSAGFPAGPDRGHEPVVADVGPSDHVDFDSDAGIEWPAAQPAAEPEANQRPGRRRALADDDLEPSSGPGRVPVEPVNEAGERAWPAAEVPQAPDSAPPTGRRRMPENFDAPAAVDGQRPGRRRMPDQDEQPDDSQLPTGRRRMPEPEDSSGRLEAEPVRRGPGRPDVPGESWSGWGRVLQPEGQSAGSDSEGGRRRMPEPPDAPAEFPSRASRVLEPEQPSPAPERRPSPRPRPQPESQAQPQPQPQQQQQPQPEPKPQDPQEARRRRWASVLDGQERAGLPPEPAEPRDPPAGPESSPESAGRPSRMRRREKTDVKLADLLAEALVAYQASTSEHPDEDVLSAYDDAAGRVADENPRREA